jgi:hypothetical protein
MWWVFVRPEPIRQAQREKRAQRVPAQLGAGLGRAGQERLV